MRPIFMFGCGLIAVMAAEAADTAIPFAGYMDYGSQSVKESGFFTGAYLRKSLAGNSLEFQYAYTDISYSDGSDNLRQSDFTLAYGGSMNENLYLRGGVHYIDSDDTYTDGGVTLFAGAEYTGSRQYTFGADIYYTNYSNFDPSLDVWQVSPHIVKTLPQGDYGSFYLDLRYNFITFRSTTIEESVVGASQKMGGVSMHTPFVITKYGEYADSYHSLQIKVTNYYKGFETAGAVWVGKQAFAVRDGGFSVFNLAEVHKGGISLQTSRTLFDALRMGAGISYERFTDTQNGEDSGVATFFATLGYSF